MAGQGGHSRILGHVTWAAISDSERVNGKNDLSSCDFVVELHLPLRGFKSYFGKLKLRHLYPTVCFDGKATRDCHSCLNIGELGNHKRSSSLCHLKFLKIVFKIQTIIIISYPPKPFIFYFFPFSYNS